MPTSAKPMLNTSILSGLDVVNLTRKLISFDTINPPGNEVEICSYLDEVLRELGFATSITSFGENRRNLVATIGGNHNKLPLGFTAHMDTVPLGAEPWTFDPFAGEIKNGNLYGRGTCDMKGGLSAVICAVNELRDIVENGPGITLVITGGEETGSDGALHLAEHSKGAYQIGGLVVAEPTDLVPLSGHKGAFWVRVTAKGKTAHGSMPEKGDNAIFKISSAIQKVRDFDFEVEAHEYLGLPTLNIGTITGGLNTNSVADRAEFTIDMRTLPGQKHSRILEQLRAHLGDEVNLETFVDLPGVWTSSEDSWFAGLEEHAAAVTNQRMGISTAPYFTDASILTPYFGEVPTTILGPGSPGVAHIVDEFCPIDQLEKSVEIYKKIILDWYSREETST